MMGRPAGAIGAVLAAADRVYQAHDWATALEVYRRLATMLPATLTSEALALAIAHCRIELAPDDALDTVVPDAPPLPESERRDVTISRIRFRARALCQAGAYARAARLLRHVAHYDAPIADTYRASIDAGLTAPDGFAGTPGGTPPFLAAEGLTDAAVAAARRTADGKRLLLVFRREVFDIPERAHEPVDLFRRSAERFGFTVRHLPSHAMPADGAASLADAIADFRPDLIVYDELFATDASARDPALAERLEAVLAAARRDRGVKVVNYFLDLWRVPAAVAFRGLGHAVDLIAHCHPGALGRGSAVENQAVYCYMLPIALPAPTVPAASIARACFAGSVYDASIARLVWWAETACRGLALDFLETDHGAPRQRSDQAFANLFRSYQLSVNFTRRPSGVTILTGRTFQALVSGGTLLEEDSADSAYFLTPGEHYAPFVTLADLTALIDRMLGDPARCARQAEAGQRWAMRHFSGDWFWAGLLRRL
jgi:hypothetical protein